MIQCVKIKVFKFQSDSINTMKKVETCFELAIFKFQSDSINTMFLQCSMDGLSSLNSNLILLIPTLRNTESGVQSNFKFQSDSINTMQIVVKVVAKSTFKFQSDSINTVDGSYNAETGVYFKFQSDSINTVSRIIGASLSFETLNSNLILLIQPC